MIYKSGYHKHIRRENLAAGGLTFVKRLLWVLVVCILTIAVHFLIKVLANNTTGEPLVPGYIAETLLGNLYLYTVITMLLLFVHLMVNPKSVGFPELYNNRWYLYHRVGFAPASMLKVKMNSTMSAVAQIYISGFFIITAFCFIMGLPMIINYVISLFFTGLTYLLFVLLFGFMFGSFGKPGAAPRIGVAIGTIGAQLLLYSQGFYSFSQATVFASNIAAQMKLGGATLLTAFCAVGVLAMIVCVAVAGKKATISSAKEFDPEDFESDGSRWSASNAPAYVEKQAARHTGETPRAERETGAFTKAQLHPANDDPYGEDDDPQQNRGRGVGLHIVGVLIFSVLTLLFAGLTAAAFVPSLLDGGLGASIAGIVGESVVRMFGSFAEALWGKIAVLVCTLLLLTVVILLLVLIKKRKRENAE